MMLEQIQNRLLLNMYSKFNFLYFNNNQNIENLIFNYLKDFKFITFHFSNISADNDKLESYHKFVIDFSSPPKQVDIILCTEKYCIIIENIEFSIINKILENLKKNNISMISTENESIKEQQAKEEFESFYRKFFKEIKINKFVVSTINSIFTFLIRRFFYPQNYFTDPSFFFIEKQFKVNEEIIEEKMCYILNSNNDDIDKNIEKINTIYNEKNAKKNFYQNFYESEFVILRCICKNCSHKYLTHFYGFLKKKDENKSEYNESIIGFIYEFMCNDTLENYVLHNKEKITEVYSLMTISRIFQVIEYLHSCSFLFRDLKPSNILLDNDFLPYVSDFDYTRDLNDDFT